MNSKICRAATAFAVSLFATTLLAQSNRTTPNTIKYRDSGIAAAKGRTGDASIEVRALINSDLTTDIEVTTGSFDGAAGTGSITKVQVKAAGQTINLNALDGGSTFTATTDAISRLDTVEVQVNVNTGSRIEVVTATGVAVLRPDLSVVSIAPPPHALVNFPATIIATIREHNGDIGARANCRLLADGVEIDRAEGIWVDAGDNVDCRFMHAFTTAGEKSLEVVVDGMNPGDWDYANNSATAQLTVYEPQAFRSWTATAREEDFYDYNYTKNPWTERTREGSGYNQTLTFAGYIGGSVDIPNLRVSTTVQTDGTTIYDDPDVAFGWIMQNPWVTCRDANFGAVTGYICQERDNPDYATFDLRYGSSDVTYHTWGYNTMEAPGDQGLVFDYVTHSSSNPIRLGNTVSFDITVSDGTAAWHAQPFISSLTATQERFDSPYRCVFSRFYGANVCSEIHRRYDIRSGSANSSQ